VNDFILPIALTVILLAARKTKIMMSYRHPLWMQIIGWLVVLAMTWMSLLTISKLF